MENMQKIEPFDLIGRIVRDTVTGFEGTAISLLFYVNGCVQVGIKPKISKKDVNKMPDVEYVDVSRGRIQLVEDKERVMPNPFELYCDDIGGDSADAPGSSEEFLG